ncbi:MAG: hypothetical protein LBG52_06120 [Candidatus Peribacteria bacterium]|jgi:hypothetical protein|nr:hypothetical protein [Candidatus Peribacteria bacterium]
MKVNTQTLNEKPIMVTVMNFELKVFRPLVSYLGLLSRRQFHYYEEEHRQEFGMFVGTGHWLISDKENEPRTVRLIGLSERERTQYKFALKQMANMGIDLPRLNGYVCINGPLQNQLAIASEDIREQLEIVEAINSLF